MLFKSSQFVECSFSRKFVKGFTLIEIVVGTAVFLIVAMAAYGAFASVFNLLNANQARLLAVNLATEQLEIARNMPYNLVGVQNSIPSGAIPYQQTVIRGGTSFLVTTIVRSIDVLLGTATTSTSTANFFQGENRLMQVTVTCDACKNTTPVSLTTQIAPKGLVASTTNGALFIQVFDSNGAPIQAAQVTVSNPTATPPIVVNDVTDASGMLRLLDVPPATNAYMITVTKAGYSSDQTYAATIQNPSPSKPYATVAAQQVTQISFSIDRLSTLSFSAVSPSCTSVGPLSMTMVGAKQIGAGIAKSDQTISLTNAGAYSTSSVEWDSYLLGITGTSYDVVGFNPLNPVTVNAGSNQNVTLVVSPHTTNGALVSVRDGATGLPVTGATVTLSSSANGYSKTLLTGQGYIDQTDWSGGAGQTSVGASNRYFTDDGNVDGSTVPGDLKLRGAFGAYNPSGILESSTFDAGTSSVFNNFIWSPASQPFGAGTSSVLFQFASSPSSTPAMWNYAGPDGTASTYYSVPNSAINSINTNNRYARYKVFLSTQSSTSTPDLSSVDVTFTSSCTPPGQAFFNGLTSGAYSVDVSAPGYSPSSTTISATSTWQEYDVSLSH